jgi:hypothetical protein
VNLITAFNIVTLVCAICAAWWAWGIYRLVRSRAVLILGVAVAYMVVVRFGITSGQAQTPCSSWWADNASYLLAGFWPLFALSMYLLHRTLREVLTSRRIGDPPKADFSERRHKEVP